MKVTKEMRKAVHSEVAQHGFPYLMPGLGNCLVCGAAPPARDVIEAHTQHAIDVAIDTTARLVAKYQPKLSKKLVN